MDYHALASELMEELVVLFHNSPQKQVGDFSRGETRILNYLADTENHTALPSELSVHMDISSARIAATLNSLEHKRMIRRRLDETDRRRILVCITDLGLHFVLQKREQIHQNVEQLLRDLGEKDAQEYVRIIQRIASNAKNKSNKR